MQNGKTWKNKVWSAIDANTMTIKKNVPSVKDDVIPLDTEYTNINTNFFIGKGHFSNEKDRDITSVLIYRFDNFADRKFSMHPPYG